MFNRVISALLRRKLIALTFDDGPDEKTPEILDLLGEHGAVGTFFVLGGMIKGREEVLRRAVESGHEIGNHTFDHPHLEKLEPSQIEEQLARTSDAIEGAAGIRPRLMRPPYGLGALRAAPIASRLGMKTVLWSVNPKDWEQPDAGRIAELILAEAHPGAVVALHDGAAHGGDRSPTVAAIRIAVPLLADRGYSFVTISQLLTRAPWIARTVIPRPRGPVRRLARRGRNLASESSVRQR